MNKLILLTVLLASGCAGRRFYAAPVIEVVVINDCPGSSLLVDSIEGEEARLPYGGRALVILPRPFFRGDGQLVMSARGFGQRGEYLGSETRHFWVGNLSRQEVWQVRFLLGGPGCLSR